MKQPHHSVYDALGRQTASQDARGGVHSRGYDEYGRVAWGREGRVSTFDK